MKRLDTDVVVIGGGSTGLGVVRDAAMRGYRAVLLERVAEAHRPRARLRGVTVEVGVLEERCRDLIDDFVLLKRQDRTEGRRCGGADQHDGAHRGCGEGSGMANTRAGRLIPSSSKRSVKRGRTPVERGAPRNLPEASTPAE